MDMQGALRARLLAAAPVTALIAQRIYWVDRPQATSLPALVLQGAGGLREQHLKGFHDLRQKRIQFEGWGLKFGDAKAVLEAAIDAAVPEHTGNGIIFNRAMVDGEVTETGERTETAFIHRHYVDLIFWWQAT